MASTPHSPSSLRGATIGPSSWVARMKSSPRTRKATSPSDALSHPRLVRLSKAPRSNRPGHQYGHLHSATTDGYGSRVSVGLRHLFPMEDALNLRTPSTRPRPTSRSTVSVPQLAATETPWQRVPAHLRRSDPHHPTNPRSGHQPPRCASTTVPSSFVACCYDASKALCRRDASDAVAVTP